MSVIKSVVMVVMASQTLLKRTAAERMRKVGMGIGLMMMSGVLALLGIIGGICSIFFALADISRFVYPFLIAGGISLLFAVIIGIEGRKLLKK